MRVTESGQCCCKGPFAKIVCRIAKRKSCAMVRGWHRVKRRGGRSNAPYAPSIESGYRMSGK